MGNWVTIEVRVPDAYVDEHPEDGCYLTPFAPNVLFVGPDIYMKDGGEERAIHRDSGRVTIVWQGEDDGMGVEDGGVVEESFLGRLRELRLPYLATDDGPREDEGGLHQVVEVYRGGTDPTEVDSRYTSDGDPVLTKEMWGELRQKAADEIIDAIETLFEELNLITGVTLENVPRWYVVGTDDLPVESDDDEYGPFSTLAEAQAVLDDPENQRVHQMEL